MHTTLKIFTFVVAVFTVSAIIFQITKLNPSASFVEDYDTVDSAMMGWDSAVCSNIQSSFLWRFGNEANDLVEYVIENLSISVDEIVLPIEDIQVYYFLQEVTVYDPFGFKIPIGSHGGSLNICFSTEDLSFGLHTASLQTKTTFGENFTFSWEFYR